MKIGPRYKIARRLGGNVFDKTQTQKFAMRAAARKEKAGKKKRAGSDFSLQLIEKQKARFTYGMGEKQFKNTVESILKKKSSNINESLVQALESRLDNVVYRLGFGKSRQATRQLVSHGHIDVNGKRVTIPSYKVSVGDVITIRERSKTKPIFKDLNEKMKEPRVPSWLSLDIDKKVSKVQGLPKIPANELAFDVSSIFQYYSR
jgi:small subunit ribosomal protein S4